MSDAWDIAPPQFNADATLLMLKRFVRDQHALTERSGGWALGGNVVMNVSVEGATVVARLARRPAQMPEWDCFTVKSAPDARKLQDEIKRRLLRWQGSE
jgi:hypothetical protein